ncbi:MAG TPA: glutamine-hydrolyzing GMP synthase, partial [Pyrinomonadaceae bacterium]|nr:glutamine-hydrolyzing GMP synthase [Pyrinomonadaceae bacterium]
MIPEIQHETVIILDFGSQYTQLIARRVREAGVYCEILPFNTPADRIMSQRPKGLILSGSPSSVYQDGAPRPDSHLLDSLNCPLLGICYGFQILAFDMGGDVESSSNREFGYARLKVVDESSLLFKELPNEMDVWMSHGDQATSVPEGFRVTALTDDALNAIENNDRRIYGVQFHP